MIEAMEGRIARRRRRVITITGACDAFRAA